MNSLVSYEWLKHYVDLKGVTPDAFAQRMSLSGPAVEKIHRRDPLLDKVVIGSITRIKKHPNADKLRIAIVDIGTKVLEIVCGGTNLAEHQLVAVAQIGAKVLWHGEGEPVKLEPIEIRGAKSEGMICAANEIGLEKAFPHEDREILDLKKEIPGCSFKPGTPLANALGLSEDVVMDIEVTSNRVDAMGMIGLAREASAIFGKRFLWKPKTLQKPKGKKTTPAAGLSVTVHEKRLCSRYMAARITGVKNGVSPWWMRERLLSAGLHSISLLVDITNYILLEHAQPMHVFDVEKCRFGKRGLELHVRLARSGEVMKALDGKVYELDDRTLVIADAEGPVAVAGIMGGERTGSYGETTDIVLECATFDPVSVRRTARRLNLYSDSQLRFEKGLSTEALPYALARAIELTCELAGGTLVAVSDVRTDAYKPLVYRVSSTEVDERIGVAIPQKRKIQILKDLGFQVAMKTKGVFTATVPWWRDHDIEAGADLIEEIARVHGYANIPAHLPIGTLPPRERDQEVVFEERLKDIACGAGLTEIYGYSFVSEDLYAKTDFSIQPALKLLNPLTEEYAFMRTSLNPSILQAIADNQDRAKMQQLFEVSNVYVSSGEGWKELPNEIPMCSAGFLAGEESFARAKGFFEHVLRTIGIQHHVSWARHSQSGFWHSGRTVQAFVDGTLIATIGEVSPKVLSNMKIDGRLALAEIHVEQLFSRAAHTKSYLPPNPFPESKRDLAIVVGEDVEYDDIEREIRKTDVRIQSVEWFDTYRGTGLEAGKKSVAVHLVFADSEKTLTSAEIDDIMERISLRLSEQVHSTIRQS